MQLSFVEGVDGKRQSAARNVICTDSPGGVVASELPADFTPDKLKSGQRLAKTFTISRLFTINNADGVARKFEASVTYFGKAEDTTLQVKINPLGRYGTIFDLENNNEICWEGTLQVDGPPFAVLMRAAKLVIDDPDYKDPDTGRPKPLVGDPRPVPIPSWV